MRREPVRRMGFGAPLFAILTACSLSAQQAAPESGGGVTPRLTIAAPRPFPDARIWAVSGSSCPVVVHLTAPPGSVARLRCELFQTAEGLAAPLKGGWDLADGLDFSGRSHLEKEVAIPLPPVERETEVVAKISMLLEGENRSPVTKSQRIHVIPGEDSPLNPISQLRRLPDGALGVTGESPRLRGFLDRMRISYIDGTGGALLVLCEGSSVPEGIPASTSLIVFSEADRRLPGVYSTSGSSGARIKVTLPIFDRLVSDTLAQITFADLISNAIPTRKSNEP